MKKQKADKNCFPVPALRYDSERKCVAVEIPDGMKADFVGSSYPQIVNENLAVWQPLNTKTVHIAFRCTDAQGNSEVCSVPVTIPGKFDLGKQKKPAVIPELAEWMRKGNGRFDTANALRVALLEGSSQRLCDMAEMFVCEFKQATDRMLTMSITDDIKDGDIFFATVNDSFLGEEGYCIDVGTAVIVTAANEKGLFWATRTLLQLFKQGGMQTCEIRDYPKYPVRGFMLDVARKPVSMSMLKEIVRTMSWYKMNDFHLHLNDNFIWIEKYIKDNELDTFDAYEAFRLESSLKNESGKTASTKDYCYSKEEFRQFIEYSKSYGVNIVPEIDVPAHALSFTKAFPEHMVKGKLAPNSKIRPLTDHLDVSDDKTIEFIKQIFDDYTTGEKPVFGKDTVVHIGADEFESDPSAYRKFFNELVPHIAKTNKVRVWGSLTHIKDDPETPIVKDAVENVEMNLWASNWADGIEMYKMGFDLINTIDQYLYMVPNGSGKRGSYTDFLDKKAVFKNFEPCLVKRADSTYAYIPQGDKHMLGAAFAIWNDNIDKAANGLTEEDLFDRFFDSAALMSEKTWANDGREKGKISELDKIQKLLGYAPCSKPVPYINSATKIHAFYHFDNLGKDTSGNNRHIEVLEGVAFHSGEMCVKSGVSYAKTPFYRLGYNDMLVFKARFNEIVPNTILFECDSPYGTCDIRITSNGRLGFTREGYEYEFKYTPPVDKDVELRIMSYRSRTYLRVNRSGKKKAYGSFSNNGEVRKTKIENSSFCIPLERIGSKTNAAKVIFQYVRVEKI